MNCINTKSKEFQELLEASKLPSLLLEMRIAKWQEQNGLDNFPKVEDIIQSNEVNQTLKAVDILSSDKAKQVFDKGNKNNWDLNKILTELQIPKEQKQLILDLGITDREQIALELSSNYSYAVEINTTKEQSGLKKDNTEFKANGVYYYSDPSRNVYKILYSVEDGGGSKTITKDEFEAARQDAKPTSYYSNLTVPGGTNYTENEIATPAITPSIKGHAQFATDNGIGWFRSDEQVLGRKYGNEKQVYNPNTEDVEFITPITVQGTITKTRRILEVQSDLFQKGRDKKGLTFTPELSEFKEGSIVETSKGKFEILGTEYNVENNIYYKKLKNLDTGQIGSVSRENFLKSLKLDTQNNFLQLLNKDNNWVTFFVKSIIQDSAKKGYEKVLFPSGNTVVKIESAGNYTNIENAKEANEKNLVNTALFYENTITNILKKQSYNSTLITDEYGNTWNEITLDNTRDESTIFMKKDLSELTTDNETNIFEDIDQKIENLENSQNDNHLSENNEMLFQSEPKLKLKASEVLNNILQSTQIDKFKESTFFLEKVLNLLNKSNATFKVISDEQFNTLSKNNTQTVMLFDSKTNEILVSRSILENNSPEFIAESFIHEVVHSITVKAYFDPQTREEHQFKEFIDKSYSQYKHLSEELDEKGNQMYGFTNQAEFIAEIYSNPKFRNKIEELEKGWLKRLLDNVRRLFGLAKNSLNEKLISSTLLFETVDNFINTVDQNNQGVYSKWKGTIFSNPKYEIFSKQSDIKTELKTIQEKLDYNIQRINESLKININKYKYLNKVFKDNKAIQAYLTTLETLKSEINTFQDANKIKGVVLFLEEMGRSLAFVENKLDNIDYSNSEDIKNTARIYDSYLTTFSVIEDVKSLLSVISEDSSQTLLNKEELNKLNELFDIRYGKYNRLNERFNEVKKEVVKNQINNIKYFPNIEKKHRDRLSLEHKNNQIPQDKETWIIDKMLNRDKDLIQEDLDKEVLNFLNNPSIDIYASDVTFSSAINVSSPMIQIMYQLLNEIENKRLFEERSKDIEFRKLFEKLVKEKGSNNVNEIYKNILDVSKSGKQYLLSEYKSEFYEEVYLKIKNLKREAYNKILENKLKMTSLSENNQINSQEYKDLLEENKKIEKDLETNVKQLENENLILDEKGKILGIKDKWKNDLSKLSETEKEVLNFFKSISQEAHKDTFGKKSLIKFLYKQNDSQNKFEKYITFYELPKVTKSSTERLWSGDIKGNLQDKWTDLTSLKPDDIGFASVETDMSGKPIHNLKIHYRSNNFDPKNQSLDLMNVYRLEYKNGNAFKHRKESELDLNFLLDVAKSKKYYENKGTNQVLNTRNKKLNLIEGENSQTLKMMQNMMESKLYDILNKTGTKIGNVEATKAVGAITSFSSFMALAFNIASGTANVVNANAQLFLESFIKGLHIKAESIKKAEEIYFKDFKGNISDVTNGLHTSFTNQVLEMFNVKGEFLFSNSNFLKSNIVKKGINLETTQMFQTSGEHWIQSIITFSVLDGIKVMNHDHKFIDKSGNVVENEKDAASLLDMLEKNENGLITFNKNVVYTTHSRLTPLNEGGKEKIDSLIIKKIHDSAGNYRATDQSELYRHWWGKLFGQYKKYLVPMGQSRLRGIETAFTSKKDLTDDQKRFSYALQEYEEGTYTTLVRYLYSSLKSGQRFVQLKENWNEMSDYEKHNIKRAITEIIITSVILPLLITLIAGAAGDDDNELLFFTAYQLRRLDTELSAYRSISESFKMMRSPIPSARILEHSLQTLTTIINPFEWDELIEEDSKGYNKFLRKQQKQIPVVRDFIKSYEDLYEFQNSSWGTSL